MTSLEMNRIESWQKQLTQNISFKILSRNLSPDDQFYAYGHLLESKCDQFKIDYQLIDKELPEIQLKDNLHFHALPEGTELMPFLNALMYNIQSPDLDSQYADIHTLPLTYLTMFVSPHCPHCPTTLQQLLPLAWLNPEIHLTIIDVGLFPEKAEAHKIQSVPAIVYQNFLWTGQIKLSEIIDVIRNNPEQWQQETLQRMLSEGKAEQLAEVILEKGHFFDNFHQLMGHELLSVRLGAMVCVEYIADENKELAKTLCDKIWQMIPGSTIQVQGDLIYLMGVCGTITHISLLKEFLNQAENPDIKDAIDEAIETIQESGETE